MRLWEYLALLYHVLGCRVFEDLSAICGGFNVPWWFSWGVPW